MKDESAILVNRAKLLAEKSVKTDDYALKKVFVEFYLLPEKYAIQGEIISEVLPLLEFTPIPGTPPFVVGVINARGRIISVLNLKSFLNLHEKGITELNKVIIIKRENMEFGILVDSIVGAKEIIMSTIHLPPANLHGLGKEYISGVTEEGVIVLNAEMIIANKSLIINQK